jgi:hypothetical protein
MGRSLLVDLAVAWWLSTVADGARYAQACGSGYPRKVPMCAVTPPPGPVNGPIAEWSAPLRVVD